MSKSGGKNLKHHTSVFMLSLHPSGIKHVLMKAMIDDSLEEEPGQQGGEAVKDTAGQVEDGADAGLQRCGGTSVDQHHLVDLLRILVGQEGAEGHTGQSEQGLVKVKGSQVFLQVFILTLALPVRVSYEDIPPACISPEDESDVLSQGIKGVCCSYLRS